MKLLKYAVCLIVFPLQSITGVSGTNQHHKSIQLITYNKTAPEGKRKLFNDN